MDKAKLDAALRVSAPNKALTCGFCGQPVADDGSGAVIVRTAGVKWQWVHELSCYREFEAQLGAARPSALSSDRVLELFERGRSAGRVRDGK